MDTKRPVDSDLARRAREIFRDAVERGPEERNAFLDRACGSGELRAEVESLLAYDLDDSDALLETRTRTDERTDGFPRRSILPAFDAAELIGRRIGAWCVLGRLGEGGMGTVYLVERADGAFEQRAALKLIRPGLWTGDLERRLEAERQILAHLRHPNIARLLDGGSTDGRPYLVMELVEGRPIDRYCDEEGLSVDARLELFGQICRAVQHAHHTLIVHRDLKPSNVVVDAEGHVTLLDFGIARALTPRGEPERPQTAVLGRVMTPSYASPEQVLGHTVTTATDVYQLGLLLFELLTGRRAQRFDNLSLADLERAIREDLIERPSAVTSAGLARRLRGDLDSIVAMALRKEPERRYGSAAELHEDVERHCRGLPVRARPDSVAYRLRRFVARNRQAVVLTALCLVILAWAVSGAQRRRLRDLREAERVRQFETVIGSLFEYPRPTDAGREPRLGDFVDHAATLIRRELRDQPAIQVRLLHRLGRTYNAMGAFEDAAATFEEALALAGPLGDLELRADLLYRRGRNQHFSGRLDAAEASFREAASLTEDAFGDAGPHAVAVRLELADLLHSQGRLREAEELLEAAARNLEAAVEARGIRELRARAQGYLANVLRDRGLLDRAEAAYQQAIAQVIDLLGPHDILAATNGMYLGRLLVVRGRLDEAERLLEEQLETVAEVHPGGHPLTAIALRDLGLAAIERGEYELAEKRLARARQISDEWLVPEHPSIPRITVVQAELARRRGRNAEAIRLSRESLGHFARLGLGGHPAALDACITLGLALRGRGGSPEPTDAARLTGCLDAAERELARSDPRTQRLRELVSR